MKKRLILFSVVLIILGASCNSSNNFGGQESSNDIDITQVVFEETEIIEKPTATHVTMPAEAAQVPNYNNWILLSINLDYDYRIAVINPETFELKILMNHEFDASYGTWAPDYKSIAIENKDGISIVPVECFVNIETCSELTERINEDDFGGWASSLNWSPDGKYIAFRYSGVSLIDIESKQIIKVTEKGDYPAWSAHFPNSIIYDAGLEIVIHDIVTGDITPILGRDDFLFAQVPVGFSPDEMQMALVIDVGNEFSDLDYRKDIVTIDVETKKVLFVIQDASNPAWSSNGKQIAFIRNRDLFIYDIVENSETQITEDLSIYSIDWGP